MKVTRRDFENKSVNRPRCGHNVSENLMSLENKKYASFLDIWYERNFETSNGLIFGKT